MERIFRLILGTLICKKNNAICVFFVFSRVDELHGPAFGVCPRLFVLGVRQEMAEFGQRFLLKTTIKTIIFAHVGTSFYFLFFFFFQNSFLENC